MYFAQLYHNDKNVIIKHRHQSCLKPGLVVPAAVTGND